MKKIVLLSIFSICTLLINAQSTESILESYAKTDEVSKMSLTGDILRMFAKEYEQREIIDKVDKVEVYLFGENGSLKKDDLAKIKINLKKDNYEELVNVRDGEMKVKILVKEKKDVITRLFMFMENPGSQTVVAEMKCSLTYDDLRKLQLEFEGAEGLKYLNGGKGKKM